MGAPISSQTRINPCRIITAYPKMTFNFGAWLAMSSTKPEAQSSGLPSFALVDCNNFFASCERVFNPSLHNKPVAVLSNNDGCIVARSNEVKELGVPMGAPLHKYRDILEKHKVAIFSSNYKVYGDMSDRVMQALDRLSPAMEVYSIDEAFLHLSSIPPEDRFDMCSEIRENIIQWLGIPVSIGIAPSKTLAKIANHAAKKRTNSGVFNISNEQTRRDVLSDLPLMEIWGISHNLTRRLNTININTALELADSPIKLIRKNFGVVGERMVMELRGYSCIDLSIGQDKKSILSSRSFHRTTSELEKLEEAVANYAARGAAKLRKQSGKAKGIHVFLRTNKFKITDPQYANSITRALPYPTSDTRILVSEAKTCLHLIYKEGYNYKKAGVMLVDLIKGDYIQQKLNGPAEDSARSDKLMQVIDSANQIMGKKTLFVASEGKRSRALTTQNHNSKEYTTSWDGLVEVR